MPVDVTDDFVWITVRDAGSFVPSSFRQITISEEQGINARIGKLQSDPQGSTVVQAYYFKKSQWSVSESEVWVKNHKRSSSIEGRKVRYIDPDQSELRSEYDKVDGPRIYGYAAIFNQKTRLFRGLWEQVAPGAFSESLDLVARKKHNVVALWQHDMSQPLGDIASGTLRVWQDDKGLAYAVNPGKTTYGLNLIENVKRGVVRQSSFGFDILDHSDLRDQETKEVTRTLKNVRLWDVSPVTIGAYPQTEGLDVREMRSAKDEKGNTVYLDGDDVIEPPTVEDSSNVPSAKEINDMVDELKKKFR
jgi:hypothetical protein